MTETKGTALLHLIICGSILITTDATQQSSTQEKAITEGKDSSSKWFHKKSFFH